MKLGKLLLSIVIVSLIVSMAIPMAAAPNPNKPGKPGDEEPPAVPAIAFFQDHMKGGNEIRVMNADGSNVAVIYKEYFHILGSPSWSPDGNSIAWSGYTYVPKVPGEDHGVWRIDVEIIDGVPRGINLQRLVTSSESLGPYDAVWSPLENEIAYWVRIVTPVGPDIWKIDAVPATGGTPYNIYTTPEGHALNIGLAWSSDGTRLAAVDGEISAGSDGKSIIVINRATGAVTHTLLTGQYSQMMRLDWARQGSNKITFYDWGVIYMVDIETETVVPVVEGVCASWSPDNSKIVYTLAVKQGKRVTVNIYTYEFSTGDITLLANGGKSPDWRRETAL